LRFIEREHKIVTWMVLDAYENGYK
jgi:hypothetical protein